jgi:hypothetical protein
MSALLRVDGSVTFWSLSESTSLGVLKAKLAAIPHPARADGWACYAPTPRTPQACLRDALASVYRSMLIRPLAKRDGFALIKETKLHDDVVMANAASVAVTKDGVVDVLKGWVDVVMVKGALDVQAGVVKPSGVTAALVAMLQTELGAVSLRPSGGVYWLPDASLPAWRQVGEAVEAAAASGRSTVYCINHQFDGASIRAVRDALLNDVAREAARIEAEVDGGLLGENALRARARQAQVLQAKVAEYERVLGERLPDAAELARKTELTATAARILAQGAA